MGKINSGTLIARSDKLISNEMDGEVVMMSIDTGTYYGLNDVGTRIWQMLDEPKDVESICGILGSEYKVDKNVCAEDVVKFIDGMIEEEIIRVV